MADNGEKVSKKAQKKAQQAAEGPKVDAKFSITFSKTATPELTRAVELQLAQNGSIKYLLNKGADSFQPVFTTIEASASTTGSISGDVTIAKYLIAQVAGSALYGGNDAWVRAQIDQYLDLFHLAAHSASLRSTLAVTLNAHLATRTFLVLNELTLADLAMVVALKKAGFVPAVDKEEVAHTSRWFAHAVATMVPLSAIPASVVPEPKAAGAAADKKAEKAPKTDGAKAEKKTGNTPSATDKGVEEDANASGEAGSCPPLEGAVEGQVVTRFPPEPSGYLHIGHAKAVLLNQYYAQRYKGKCLIRFDDTNPSKEKDEFEENILKDLQTLQVNTDWVTHSSDHFDKCEELARQMIRDQLAYMDNTEQEQMQAERMAKTESRCRNQSVEENLKWFEELLQGTPAGQGYCMRAKIDMNSVNGTMRDPVMYRFNDTPHHRTGTKYKAYPTYDFVCPIVDAIEGVTHALRTTEYNDRDEQYHWIQNALRLRYVHIYTYGRMNFVHTVLSKRKLQWFVEQGIVEGWFDPRFPTVQGCIRRGVNVEALKGFIISQGASRRVITMEWDKFWAENKKILEEKAPRYMGVNLVGRVEVHLTNVKEGVTDHTVQIHPQKAELGNRIMRRSHKVFIDQEDAASYKVGEEVTLLRWGNINIVAIHKNADGVITKIEATHDENATNFSKTKKATWIAVTDDLVPCKLIEFDHIISKAKLTDEDKFEDHINYQTKFETDATCDACLAGVKQGDVIQLERKGFFRVDAPFDAATNTPAVLFMIPDGKISKNSCVYRQQQEALAAGGKKK